MPERPAVSVVIVTHEHERFIGSCLESLAADVTSGLAEVVVVDNRSADRSADLAASYGWPAVVVGLERRGFAANANLGMAAGRGRHLLCLNPDTVVHPGALAQLVEAMDGHPSAGLCGAALVNPDGSPQPSARRFPGVRAAIARRSPLRRVLRSSRWNRRHLMLDGAGAPEGDDPHPVDWLLGACLLVRRAALAAVGPLDEGFRLYVEDIDWARRMHDGGWGVYYVPAARITHHHQGVSDRRLLGRHARWHYLGMLRYARKHFGPDLPVWRVRAARTEVWDAATGQPAARS